MKIALVHDFLTVYGGAERVLKEFHLLFPEAPIFTGVADARLVKEHFPNATVRTSWLQRSWKRRINPIFLLNLPKAMESFDFTGYEVVLSSSGAFAHGVITGPYTRHISYCHSPMRYAWDWHAEFLREKGFAHGWLKPFIANQAMSNLRLWDAVSSKRVDTWIANARTVHDRIAKYYRAESTVIFPPVDTDYFDSKKLGEVPERGPHVLSVSRLSSAKKIDQIIRACHQANVPLRIAGAGDEQWLKAIAADLEANVTFLGEVSEEVKRRELAAASAFIFASEDDFGIAPVEAMAMGTPVIAFGKGGATETVLDGTTGLLYPEQSVDSLAATLERFRERGVKGSAEGIRKQALRFGNEEFRAKIRSVVEQHA